MLNLNELSELREWSLERRRKAFEETCSMMRTVTDAVSQLSLRINAELPRIGQTLKTELSIVYADYNYGSYAYISFTGVPVSVMKQALDNLGIDYDVICFDEKVRSFCFTHVFKDCKEED